MNCVNRESLGKVLGFHAHEIPDEMNLGTSQVPERRSQQIQMLIVEDDVDFVESARESLAVTGRNQFFVENVTTLADAVSRAKRRDIDIILLDLGLPDSDRFQTFDRLSTYVSHIPVIIISGHDDEDLAIRAVQAGAQDYLVKGQITPQLLIRVTRHAIERKRLVESLRDRETFFRLITENIQDLIVVLDRHGKRLYTSPSYKALIGHGENHIGTNSFENIHPDDLPRVESVFRETVATGIGQRAEYRFLTESGSTRYIESQGTAIKNALGQTEKVVVVSRDITSRKLAEQELRESEQRYKHLLGAVTDYIYSVRLEENGEEKTTHGPTCIEVTGYSSAELEQHQWLGIEMIPESDRPAVEAMVKATREGFITGPIEHRIRHKSGETKWVRTVTVPHFDPQGKVTSYDGLITDITDQRETANRLRTSESQYQSLVENLPQCIMRKDIEGRFTFVNNQFAKLVGFTPEEIIGKTDFDLYTPDMAEKFQNDDRLVMETRELLETMEENITANGNIYFVQVVKIPIQNHVGVITGVQCIFWDVTAAKKAQEELHRREKLLQAIMDQTPAVIYLKDPKGRYLYINQEFEKLFHLKRGNTISKTDFDIFPPEIAERFRENDAMILSKGRPYSIDEQAPHDDGLHDYLSVKFPIFDPNGNPYALCGISTDITDRKRFEKKLQRKNLDLKQALGELSETRMQLIQAEKLKSIGTLAAGVAHEVKNPLQILLLGVNGLSYLIPDKNEDTRLTLAEMKNAINRADTIIRELLDFSRLEKLNLRPANINPLIQDVLQLVKFQLLDAHVTVDLNLATDLPSLRIDRQKMQQVLINLITNSVHAMNERGTIRIVTRGRFLDDDEELTGLGDTTHFIPGDPVVTIELFDNGPGIPPDVCPRIFDPFFTTKPPGKGTGLGLPVAQNIIALHSGTINIENHPDGGVHVKITLKHRKDKHEQKKNSRRR